MHVGQKTVDTVPFRVHPYAALFKRSGLYVCSYDYRRIDDRQYRYSREEVSENPALIRDMFIGTFEVHTVLRFNDWLQHITGKETAHCPPVQR